MYVLFCVLSHSMNNFRKSTTLKLFVPFSHWPQNNWLVGSGGKKAIMIFVCSALHALVTLRCGWLEKESARKTHNKPTLMATRNAKKSRKSVDSIPENKTRIKLKVVFCSLSRSKNRFPNVFHQNVWMKKYTIIHARIRFILTATNFHRLRFFCLNFIVGFFLFCLLNRFFFRCIEDLFFIRVYWNKTINITFAMV